MVRGMHVSPRSTFLGIAASLVLHVLALSALPARLDAVETSEQAYIDMSLVALPVLQPTAASATVPEPVHAVAPPRPARRAQTQLRSVADESLTVSVSPEPDQGTQPPAPTPGRPPVDAARIRPEEVARMAVAREQQAKELATQRRDHALDASLHGAAAERPVLERRGAPQLRPRSNGSYEWRGEVIRAIIAADGTVTFKDPPLLDFAGFATPHDAEPSLTEHIGQAPGASRVQRIRGGLVFHFDVVDLVERALGAQSYTSERQWFLEQTAELRETMAMRQRLCGSTDQRALREYLANSLRNQEVTAVHDEIFAAYRACAGSSYGPAATSLIVAFVRTHLAQGSARAYSAQELAKLNAAGAVTFVPYDTP